MTGVPPSGPLHASLAIVGEAPAAHEIHHNPPTPFVGPSGFRLNEWLEAVGLRRVDCYVDNVYPYQAPGNKLERVDANTLKTAMASLNERLLQLPNLKMIVTLGNYPLYAVTGLGSVHWHRKDGKLTRPGITAHRGSIYTYPHRPNVRVIRPFTPQPPSKTRL